MLFLPVLCTNNAYLCSKTKKLFETQLKQTSNSFFRRNLQILNQVSTQELSKYSWGELETAQEYLPVIKLSGIQQQLKGMEKISINSEAELTLFNAIHQALSVDLKSLRVLLLLQAKVQTFDAAKAQYFPLNLWWY